METSRSSPDHPIAAALRKLGSLHLVGSRAFAPIWEDCKRVDVWTETSDWDYYLGVAKLPETYSRSLRWAVLAIEDLGFVRLPGEGGPYGPDQMIEGVFRLPETTAFGVAYPHVDVILCERDEVVRRMAIWDRIRGCEARGARMCRGMKAERAWGAFWWSTLVPGRTT